MECTNCFEFYDEEIHIPLNLDCGHTFCKACICGLIANAIKLECPICRRVILRANIAVHDSRETFKKFRSFGNDKKNPKHKKHF